jgi:endonuclease/exonuclease/phosphatase (EEP) superfamily protein YafD
VLAIATALMPFVAATALLGLVVALLSRNRVIIVLALVLAALNVAWQLPLFVPDGGSTGAPVLRVATANLKYGSGDAASIVALVRDHDVDVLALEELTPDAVQRLHDAGLDDLLPYNVARPDPSFTGTGLWSRTPLTDTRELSGFTSAALVTHATTGAGPVTLLAVHPVAPSPYAHDMWDSEYAELRTDLAAIPGPVVVAGDFNATRDQKPFLDLESDGFRDAADQAGAGFQMTFPHARSTGRALVAIDHVIVRDLGVRAISLQTQVISGSDHLAVVVDYG